MDNEETYEDHYEALQLNPNADQETIQRVFRLLAKRYHPDNRETGDVDRFNRLMKAYEVLSNPSGRARYDGRYYANRSNHWKIFDRNTSDTDQDKRIFDSVLSMLYIARRQNPRRPGLGILEVERMLGCPPEYLEFHIWYLKEKKWIERTEDGQLAISVAGVEKVAQGHIALRADRLIEQQTHHSSVDAQPGNADSSDAFVQGQAE